MKNKEMCRNFIIYVFLFVLLITGVGYGLGEEGQVFSSYATEQKSSISIPTFSANSDLNTFQVKERNSVALRYRGLKSHSGETTVRGGFVFLCILTILSVFFRLIQERFIYYNRLYIRDRFAVIHFMQDMDGRKRFS